ncbi:MAG: MBL fold metallo-hydrolase, partial [Methylococcales bacterium]
MNKTFRALALLSLTFFATSSLAGFLDQDFSKISLKTTHVRGNIYMLEGVGGFAGGNIGVSAGADGVLLVDDQLSPMPEKINAALTDISKGKLRFILNTHWHGDHTGSNAHFSKHATIISHANVRKRLMADQENFFGKSPASPKEAWPLITFEDAVNIHFNDEDIQFIHYAHGHTDGDAVVYFPKSNVAHLGDHFFNGIFPFVDL